MSPLARYLNGVHVIHATGGATSETAYYGPLEALLNSVGERQKPAVRAVFQLRSLGAGHPDFGLFTSEQFERRDGHSLKAGQIQKPARGVGEVKGAAADLDALIASEQVDRYLSAYGLLLATNLRQFAVVARGASAGQPVVVERFTLAETEAGFWALAAHPDRVAGETAEDLTSFLERALRHAAPVDEPRDLAWFLASYAREARARLDRLATEPGGLDALAGLRGSLETTLGAHFTGERGERFFRATVVQTLFYGVFSAWTLWHRDTDALPPDAPERQTEFLWRQSVDYLHVPVLAELFHQLTGPGVRKLGLTDLLDRTQRLLARVRRERFFARFRDAEAIQYFYEPFLEAYDPVLRKELGVWYTPPEVVRYMVARVDRVLRDELNEPDGLASENVVVLDPCCGTGAFLVETLRHIRRVLASRPDTRNRVGSLLRTAATERLFGFEVLTAPFVVAHLQIGLALRDAGAPLADDQRAAVYLTNALTGWTPQKDEVAPDLDRLPVQFREEVGASRTVKRDKRILVVLGNPPYEGHPGFAAAEERELVEAYRTPASTALPRPAGRGLNDLYVRFFRVAERQIAETTGRGVVCFISNNSWLDGSSHPAMRERVLSAFDRVWIDNLNGDKYRTGKTTPDGDPDPSVFSSTGAPEGIQVGTAIALLARTAAHDGRTPAEVRYRDFWGAAKVKTLGSLAAEGTLEGLGLRPPEYALLQPDPQLGLPLLPRQAAEGYFEWPTLPNLFPAYFAGVQTARDEALVDTDRDRLDARMRRYFDPTVSDADLADTDPALMRTTQRFDAAATRQMLLRVGMSAGQIVPYHYRPFDVRWLFWIGQTKLLDEKRADYARHVFDGNRWIVSQPQPRREWSVPQVARDLGCLDVMDRGASFIPLLLAPDITSAGAPRPNLSERARRHADALGVTAEDLFYHALATLHAPAYRAENSGALRQDWPRVALPDDPDALRRSAALGRRVASLLDPHAAVDGVTTGTIRPELAAIARLERTDGGQLDERDPDQLAVTARWGYLGSRGQTMPGAGRTETHPKPPAQPIALGPDAVDVMLNDGTRWADVPERVWSLALGGYLVLKKWLSYRDASVLGRPLTLAEADHFRDTTRRLAALLLMESDLDASYAATAHPASPYAPTPMTLDDLRVLMARPESPRLEFKAATGSYSAEKALEYLCAIANEGGGHLVFGVTDKAPRKIEGSQAFPSIDAHLKNWVDAVRRPIRPHEVHDEQGSRVLILEVEGRPKGEYVTYKGVPYVRIGESIVQMSAERMKEIALEETDTSKLTVPGLTIDDLDPKAVQAFRDDIIDKTSSDQVKRTYGAMEPIELLKSAGLASQDGALNQAALLIAGTEYAIREHLRHAEVIFQYRADPEAIRPDRRVPVRAPLVLGLASLMSEIRPLVEGDPIEVFRGTRVVQLPRYADRSIREAILNATAHRAYTDPRPVEVYLSPGSFVVQSPGRFPQGVTPENVADAKQWRNGALAEALDSCGLIERSGLGVNIMMAAAVHQAQPLPTFEEPDQAAVRVTLHGESTPHFLQFTQQIPIEAWENTPPAALRAVDAMRRNLPHDRMDPDGAAWLLDKGLVQRTQEGYLRPADAYFDKIPAADQRKFGFDGLKDALVALLQKHVPVGLSMPEIEADFPDHDRKHLRRLLTAMRDTRVQMDGATKGARWHVMTAPA